MSISKVGSTLPVQYWRTNAAAMDASSWWATYNQALEYATNNGTEDYCPYNGQIVYCSDTDKLYRLSKSSTTYSDTKGHYVLNDLGPGTLYGLTLQMNGSTVGTYNPSSAAKTINLVEQYKGTVTSVGLSMPTGFSLSTSLITSSGTFSVTYASGYSLPTTAKQSNWDSAYTWVSNNGDNVVSEMHTHNNQSVLDGITSTLVSQWNSASSSSHSHTNKSVLDGITSALVTNWNDAYTNMHTHANKSVLDGITSELVNNWGSAYSSSHTHANKTQLDAITADDITWIHTLISYITYDSTNSAVKINTNLSATGGVTAYTT